MQASEALSKAQALIGILKIGLDSCDYCESLGVHIIDIYDDNKLIEKAKPTDDYAGRRIRGLYFTKVDSEENRNLLRKHLMHCPIYVMYEGEKYDIHIVSARDDSVLERLECPFYKQKGALYREDAAERTAALLALLILDASNQAEIVGNVSDKELERVRKGEGIPRKG